MTDCIFCKIAAGEMNTKFIYEDDQIVVFPDLYPKATTHMLVTSKQHISSLLSVTEDDAQLMAHMVCMLPKIAKILGLKGFRTIINTGKEGGQEINHLHFHLIAGNLPKFG
jgi:histidine triad (HIT) family protein